MCVCGARLFDVQPAVPRPVVRVLRRLHHGVRHTCPCHYLPALCFSLSPFPLLMPVRSARGRRRSLKLLSRRIGSLPGTDDGRLAGDPDDAPTPMHSMPRDPASRGGRGVAERDSCMWKRAIGTRRYDASVRVLYQVQYQQYWQDYY